MTKKQKREVEGAIVAIEGALFESQECLKCIEARIKKIKEIILKESSEEQRDKKILDKFGF